MMSVSPTSKKKQSESKEKQTGNLPEIEISPYIRAVMEGAPPRYLEYEMKALKIAEKLGWEAQKDGSPAIKPGSRMDYLWNNPEEVDKLLREHGVEPEEFDRILQSGKGGLPGFGKQKNKSL
jgi:hypothetical protein